MWYFTEQKERLKKELTPKLSITEMISEAKEIGKGKDTENPGLISPEIDRAEFMLRYKGVSFALYVNILVLFVCLYQMITVETAMSFFTCVALTIISGMFYLKYSFSAWLARQLLINWENRLNVKPVSMNEFIHIALSDWKQFFPLTIK